MLDLMTTISMYACRFRWHIHISISESYVPFVLQQTVTVRNHLMALGFPNATYASTSAEALQYYLDNGGQHSEAYWGARFHVPMTYAYPPLVDEALPL
jgi:hypothetical protein